MTDSVEVEEYEEPDYTRPIGQAPTALQSRFAEWLQSDAVGYNPAAAKSKKEAFEEGVRLGVALRIPYQASEHNREATAAEKAERAEARAAAEAERAARKAAKPQVEETEEAPAPKAAKPAKAAPAGRKPKPAAAPTPAPTAATRPAARRAPARRAPAATATTPDAPF